MAKLSIRDLDLSGKRVLIRVDFNVPQDKSHRCHHQQPAHRRRAARPSSSRWKMAPRSFSCPTSAVRTAQKVEKFSLKPVADELVQAARQTRHLPPGLRRPRSRGRLRSRQTPARRGRPVGKPPLPHRGRGQGQDMKTAPPSRRIPQRSPPSAPASPSSAMST